MASLKRFCGVFRTLFKIRRSSDQLQSSLQTQRYLSDGFYKSCRRSQYFRILGNAAFTVLGIGGSLFGIYNYKEIQLHKNIVKAEANNKQTDKIVMSRREKRFHDFASSEYNDQVVMTPLDFIESLIENEPVLPRSSKIRLTEKEVTRLIKRTPNITQGSNTFFRDLHHHGIITYSEYLFLVTVLTKSTAGLKIALKMMDVNGDHIISIEEFNSIVAMINRSASKNTRTRTDSDLKLDRTTLLTHLFGPDGKGVVSFERFFKFMDYFQSEVLELEFHEYSKSLKRISEIDFARILLRNTILTEKDHSRYLDCLRKRIEHPKGITLEQFKSFHSFLNNIEDFIITVNMTVALNQPMDKELFSRAIKVSTDADIHPYVIDVIFKLFDKDGDGKLSQNEFIGIMKDRLKRGFGKFPNVKGFEGFKRCVKKEMTHVD